MKSRLSSLLILLAVLTGVAFCSGYWLGILSIPEEYPKYIRERLWLMGSQVVRDDENGQWNISVILQNKGQDNSTIEFLLFEGQNLFVWIPNNDPMFLDVISNITVSPLPIFEIKGARHYGDNVENKTITIAIKYGTEGFTSEATIEIIFHTSAGVDYPVTVTLP